MKKVLILSSGGLDSTYLVYENLKKGNLVRTLYTTVQNNGHKPESEKKSLELQKEYFLKNFPNQLETYYNNVEILISYPQDNLILKQIPLWIMSMLYYCEGVDEIQVGYVMNDDAISFLEDIKGIYKSYEFLFDNKCPELIFPLTKTKKEEIINKIPQELINTIVFCEAPLYGGEKYKPCGGCAVCKRYKNNGLFEIIINSNHKVYLEKTSDIQDLIVPYEELKGLVENLSDSDSEK